MVSAAAGAVKQDGEVVRVMIAYDLMSFIMRSNMEGAVGGTMFTPDVVSGTATGDEVASTAFTTRRGRSQEMNVTNVIIITHDDGDG